ncbi:dihydrofolate reductase family protein [Glycomyces arizonensis]|uniref:dihydrofolate reductase family protein n=1 Tax=Glycomyces arizonensis TaxID=256035 RepID=UPI000425D27B|nr:dihydrofolate reductase family protein [Glycomyces arizonensis]
MPELRVHNLTISLDGYAAGPGQSTHDPMGAGGERLHEWALRTRAGQEQFFGRCGGEDGIDDALWRRGDEGIGATIMGRNMFGPVRGPWPDESWTGWWGDEPPYHHPVFVLTHHARPPLAMEGGTVFHFVTDGIEAALERAFDAAGGDDVRLGGGPATVQAYLRAGLVDELHVAITPILLGGGERLFDGIGPGLGYECVELVTSPSVVHARFRKVAPSGPPITIP